MKFSSRFDGSICGTSFIRRPSICWAATAPASYAEATSRRINRSLAVKARSICARSSLALPRLCSSATKLATPSITPETPSIPRCARTITRRYAQTQIAASPETDEHVAETRPESVASVPLEQQSKQELLDLVGPYHENDTVQAHLEYIRDPYLRKYAPANELEVVVSNKIGDASAPRRRDVMAPNATESRDLSALLSAVRDRLRHPGRTSAAHVYELYSKLPQPRMSYITGDVRHRLLRALGQRHSTRRTSRDMLRYFAVVADVKAAGFSLLPSEWNTAMSLASRNLGLVREANVESALKLWREMEQTSGVPGNEVTFNILFDVAAKAGNFQLAEMIFREMLHRNIWFNRYHHVSLIYFFGLKMDGDGVRAAYKEMVEAGQIIDHVVLNCVIAAFLACGEEDAAMRVYEQMKAQYLPAATWPARDYRIQKTITKVLMMFARIGSRHPELMPAFQRGNPISPDLQTYRILLRHFAIKLGKIDQVARYLDEMKLFRIPLNGSVFLSLFKAFAVHGSPDRGASHWSPQRLFSVWEALLHALDNEVEGLAVETWLAMWVLRAFEKCGCRGMIVDVYDELGARWNLDERQSEFMAQFLYSMMKRLGMNH